MCSYLPNTTSDYVYFDHIENNEVISLKAPWAQCLSAVAPSNNEPWSIFMLIDSSYHV